MEGSQKGQEHCFQFLKESEERGRDLLITAIRELRSVLSGKKGKKRKADRKFDSSDEDWKENFWTEPKAMNSYVLFNTVLCTLQIRQNTLKFKEVT